ncbi:hypothetical protein [Gulosibacter sp. 10]|uniref:hypothetical protein n=1 Tax=Gulosibacter sp. 10 TaxID=1255570 RepID=UPI00097F06B3|nr:hypothetical protein [Gulosibacter sp. 10]SJM69661.1 hypothetical protein FM112_14370 [Gulosibacter sp. 10]
MSKAESHQGIPTIYNGVRFRSRTEARWAALFDLIGWEYEYEPLDFDGYIPDFLVDGAFWVEVKAATTQAELRAEAPQGAQGARTGR